MKKFMTFLMLMLSGIQGAYAMSVDEFIDKNIAPVTDFIAKSTFVSEVELADGDRIITLSTCSYEFNNARYVLIGTLKKI